MYQSLYSSSRSGVDGLDCTNMIALGMGSTSLGAGCAFGDTLNPRPGSASGHAGSLTHRGRLCALLAGFLLAAPATRAVRATTPDPCAGTFHSTDEYEAGFARLAAFGGGWSTADGYVPVALPDGRTAWLMSDTLLAPPAVAEMRRRPSCTTASWCSAGGASPR